MSGLFALLHPQLPGGAPHQRLSLALSLSLIHTHTHTHARTHARTHAHTTHARTDLKRFAACLLFDLGGHECRDIVLPHKRLDSTAIPALPEIDDVPVEPLAIKALLRLY